ncbi:MAG: low molecular weight phosphotyrosine protein phosphatase [Acidimicrobiaceae bacterium]|nr:low molecular weight phosphotyrosine protein phosphatase [Acidimicrobiaceae bacterium]
MSERTLNIAMICTGNICRSPMAEVALRELIAEDSFLIGRVFVSSAGTANWHVGCDMDSRARAALDNAGISQAGSTAAFADSVYLNRQDLVIAMTREQVHDVERRLTNPNTRVLLLRNLLQPGLDLDLEDPYYGSQLDFERCLDVLRDAARCLVVEFRRHLSAGSRDV